MNTTAGNPFAAPASRPGRERLVTMLIFALLAHGLIILGIGFVALAPRHSTGSAVNITLVNTKESAPPKQAAYLARINQRGPGNTRRHVFARPAPASPRPFPNPGFAAAQRFAAALPNLAAAQALDSTPAQKPAPDIVTTRADSAAAVRRHADSAGNSRPTLRLRFAQAAPRPGASRSPAVELPRLYGPRAKAAAHSVNALAALAAPYLLAWQQRIERTGTAQFARLVPGNVHGGHLTLAVTLAADGNVRSVAIIKRSQHTLLDAAALKIIRLAAPFPPFPPALAARTRTLSFSYRWNFIRDRTGTGILGLGGG